MPIKTLCGYSFKMSVTADLTGSFNVRKLQIKIAHILTIMGHLYIENDNILAYGRKSIRVCNLL